VETPRPIELGAKILDSQKNHDQDDDRKDFEIAFSIDDVNRLLRLAFDERMNALGLTKSSWRLISTLSRENGMSQVELSRRLGMSRVSIGWLIDRLEKSGHVERRADANDRRVWRVFLTTTAETEIDVMSDLAHKFCKEVFSPLSDQQFEDLWKSLRAVRKQLLTMAPNGTR